MLFLGKIFTFFLFIHLAFTGYVMAEGQAGHNNIFKDTQPQRLAVEKAYVGALNKTTKKNECCNAVLNSNGKSNKKVEAACQGGAVLGYKRFGMNAKDLADLGSAGLSLLGGVFMTLEGQYCAASISAIGLVSLHEDAVHACQKLQTECSDSIYDLKKSLQSLGQAIQRVLNLSADKDGVVSPKIVTTTYDDYKTTWKDIKNEQIDNQVLSDFIFYLSGSDSVATESSIKGLNSDCELNPDENKRIAKMQAEAEAGKAALRESLNASGPMCSQIMAVLNEKGLSGLKNWTPSGWDTDGVGMNNLQATNPDTKALSDGFLSNKLQQGTPDLNFAGKDRGSGKVEGGGLSMASAPGAGGGGSAPPEEEAEEEEKESTPSIASDGSSSRAGRGGSVRSIFQSSGGSYSGHLPEQISQKSIAKTVKENRGLASVGRSAAPLIGQAHSSIWSQHQSGFYRNCPMIKSCEMKTLPKR